MNKNLVGIQGLPSAAKDHYQIWFTFYNKGQQTKYKESIMSLSLALLVATVVRTFFAGPKLSLSRTRTSIRVTHRLVVIDIILKTKLVNQ